MLTLKLQRWMCHQDLEISTTAPVSFVVAQNGCGKTAIRDAIEFVYLGTGHLRGIMTKKELGQLAIADGEASCCVSLRTEQMMVSRSMKRDGTQGLTRQERPADGVWGEPQVLAPRRDGKSPLNGIAGEALRAMIEPTGFFRMDASDRREILIQSTSDESSLDEIVGALRMVLEPDDDADVSAIVTAGGWADSGGFRFAEGQAAEARKRAKRELAEVTLVEPVHEAEIELEVREGIETMTLQDFQARLEEVRELHVRAIAAESSGTAALEGQLTEAQAVLKKAGEADYEKQDKEAAKVLAEAMKEVEVDLAELERANKELQENADATERAKKPEAEADPEEFTRPGKCPAVDFDYSCPVKTQTFIKNRIGARRDGGAQADGGAELEGLKDRKPFLLKAQQEASEALRGAQSLLAGAEERAKKEQKRQAREDAASDAIVQARTRVQEIEGQILEAKETSQEAKGESAADLALRIERGSRLVEAKRTWDLAVGFYEAALALKASLEAQVARWDEIAKALKPEGIEATLGGGARERFLELLAETAEFAGRITLTPEFELVVERDGEERHPLQLSTSQRLALGVAVQHALARMVEFPVLCCDAIDVFDQVTRGGWAAFAQVVSSHYLGGVLGLATLAAGEPVAPPAGFETFWIQPDGELVKLERGS